MCFYKYCGFFTLTKVLHVFFEDLQKNLVSSQNKLKYSEKLI